MQITQFTDYSIRVLLFLGYRKRKSTIREIANHFGISHNHLTKVVHHLVELGWIKSRKGLGGGIELLIDPKVARLGDLVAETEPHLKIKICTETYPERVCPIKGGCMLVCVIDAGKTAFVEKLNQYTIQTLIDSPYNEVSEIDAKKAKVSG